MTTQTLSLRYFEEPHALSNVDIKRSVRLPFLGTTVTFTIIGSSHYVAAPEIGFYELCSCEPVGGGTGTRVPLSVGYEHAVTYEREDLHLETRIAGEPLSAFPDPETADVAYRFGPDAYTTITRVDLRTYETYHTYPEHDLALYTEQTFERAPTVEFETLDADKQRAARSPGRWGPADAGVTPVVTTTEKNRTADSTSEGNR